MKTIYSKSPALRILQKTRHEAATKIQANIKRYLVQKKYTIPQLKQHELTDYRLDIVGNDPIFSNLPKVESTTGRTLVVGISGARSIWIAGEVANRQTQIPKIILIDNSANVTFFWQELKKIAYKANNPSDFLQQLNDLVNTNLTLFGEEFPDDIFNSMQSVHYHNTDYKLFFIQLFARYTFERTKSMIINTTVLKQSWELSGLFEKINAYRQMLQINSTVVYASNLLAYLIYYNEIEAAKLVLNNICTLAPDLTIHTNFNPLHCAPDQFDYIVGSDCAEMQRKIFNDYYQDLQQLSPSYDSTITHHTPVDNSTRSTPYATGITNQSLLFKPISDNSSNSGDNLIEIGFTSVASPSI